MVKITSNKAKNLIGTLGTTIFLLLMLSFTASAAVADTWQSPLPSYKLSGYTFGQHVGNYYHAGEDLAASQYTKVKPVANGKVVWSGTASNFGWVVVVEHTMPDNSKICSIYGHLSSKAIYKAVPVGTEVTRDTVIGYIGNDLENGDGGPHLHLQINNGAGTGSTWSYKARFTTSAELTKCKKPSDYLKLIRAVDTQNVYYINAANNKELVPTANVFKSRNWRWEDVRPVTSSELNRIPTSTAVVVFGDGAFLKKEGGYEISLIRGGLRHPLASWDAYLRYGGSPDQKNVMPVTPYEYNLNALGNIYS